MDTMETFIQLVHQVTFKYEPETKTYDIHFQLEKDMPMSYVNADKIDYALGILIKRIRSTKASNPFKKDNFKSSKEYNPFK